MERLPSWPSEWPRLPRPKNKIDRPGAHQQQAGRYKNKKLFFDYMSTTSDCHSYISAEADLDGRDNLDMSATNPEPRPTNDTSDIYNK